MKKRTLKRLLSLTLVIAALLCCFVPISASALNVERQKLSLTQQYPGDVYAVLEMSDCAPIVKIVYSTRTLHYSGDISVLHSPSEQPVTGRMNGNLTCPASAGLSAELASKATASFTSVLAGRMDVNSTVDYMVPAGTVVVVDDSPTNFTGYYYIGVKFPGQSGEKKVDVVNNGATANLWEDSIYFAPKSAGMEIVHERRVD